MHRASLTVLALVLIAPLALGAHPIESPPECPFTSYFPADAETRTYAVYVTLDEIMSNGYVISAWIYAESNGMDGLQRYDSYCTNGSGDEYRENHDFIVF